MEELKRKVFNGTAVTLAGLVSFSLLFLLFSPALKTKEQSLEEKRLELRLAEELLSRKKDYEKEWESKKAFVQPHLKPEEALNLWVKELLSYATSQNLTFTKMEPQGIKRRGEGEKGGKGEIRLFLAFHGDIRKLLYLLYHLLEKDPLTRMEALSIKEEDKLFSYELTLGKILL